MGRASNIAQLNSDFVPADQVLNNYYMVWTDYAIIRLNTLFDSLGSIGLTSRADMFIRLYVNTGTLNVAVSSPNTATPGYSTTSTNNGFNGSCPFTINYLPDTSFINDSDKLIGPAASPRRATITP